MPAPKKTSSIAKPAKLPALWRCPKCGERFVTRNLWHSCGKYTLEELFERSEPHVIKLFRKFAAMVRACGPVRMISQKTRVCFQVRVRFAGAVPRKTYFIANLALPYRAQDPRFTRVDDYAPHWHRHEFPVSRERDLDARVQQWLKESYEVGAQTLLHDETAPTLLKTPRSAS